MPQFEEIRRSANRQSRSALRYAKPIAQDMLARLQAWAFQLDRQLDRFLKGRVPRSQQRLLKMMIRVVAAVISLLLFLYFFYVFFLVLVVLAFQSFLRIKRVERDPDRRLLREAQDEGFED